MTNDPENRTHLSRYKLLDALTAGEWDDLVPGEKEVRNPRIAAAFRRLALCEQAGTGIRTAPHSSRQQYQTTGKGQAAISE